MNASRFAGCRSALAASALAVVALSATCPIASAQPADNFFHDKTISMVISTGVGGGYDLMGRIIARHLAKHIQGAPTIVPRNMGGAGHVRAANYMFRNAPKDGTTLATIGNTIALHQVIDGKGVQYDAGRFNWIGTVQSANINLYVWTKEGVRTLDDAKKREVLLGATGAGGGNEIYPALLNNILGTRFRVIAGYGTGSDIHIAMERGEVDGLAGNNFASLKASNADWLRERKITLLVQFGLTPEKGFESVPNLIDLARNDTERAIFKLFSSPSALGWPVTTTPQVPSQRVKILRQAFAAMAKDPTFVADAERLRIAVAPVTGEALQAIVRDTVKTPPDIVAAAKQAISATDMVKGSVAKPRGAGKAQP
jgi:tripartite-type tricarboxylate transporter receptor subunit TctC